MENIQELTLFWREMIFVQPFWYNFLYNFLSHTYIMFLFSLFLFFSLLFLTNKKREQQSCLKCCTKMIVKISLLFFWYNRIDIWLQLIYFILYMHVVTKDHMDYYINYFLLLKIYNYIHVVRYVGLGHVMTNDGANRAWA